MISSHEQIVKTGWNIMTCLEISTHVLMVFGNVLSLIYSGNTGLRDAVAAGSMVRELDGVRRMLGTSIPTLSGSKQLEEDLRKEVQNLCRHFQTYLFAISKILKQAQALDFNLPNNLDWSDDTKHAFIGFLDTVSCGALNHTWNRINLASSV